MSRTQELADYPTPENSFLAAAVRAILRAGHAVCDMSTGTAADADSSTVSARWARECDVYVGIFGFRYGTVVKGESRSYTELEYDTAGEAGRPRLVFLVAESPAVPDPRQEALRERARAAHVVSFVRTPEELETALLQSLHELNPPPAQPIWDQYVVVRDNGRAFAVQGDGARLIIHTNHQGDVDPSAPVT